MHSTRRMPGDYGRYHFACFLKWVVRIERLCAWSPRRYTTRVRRSRGLIWSPPTLRDRLKSISLPTLVLWGESDQIVDPDYGRVYAGAIPTARFQLLAGTGHGPQIETPQQLLSPIWS